MMRLFSRRAALFWVLLVFIPLFFVRICFLFPHPGGTEITDVTPEESSFGNISPNLRGGRPVQALYQIEVQAAQIGWTPDSLKLAGYLWRDMGDVTRALPYWEAAALSLPDDVALVRSLAQAYVDLQRWPQARDMLGRLVALAPDDHWAHYQLGLVLAAFDPHAAEAHLLEVLYDPFYAEDAEALLQVLEDNSSDRLVSLHVGITLSGLELWPYAELAFERASNLAQPFAELLAYTGLARDRQGKDGSAWMEQAVALDPQNPQVLYLLGLHLRSVDDLEGSLEALIQAVSLTPQNPAFYAELGTAYRLTGNLTQAEHWLQVAVWVSDNDPEFLRLLALFYAEESYNLTSAGMGALNELAVQLSDDPDLKAAFGWALHTVGETLTGLAQIEDALTIAPDNPRALYEKARIFLEISREDEAVDLLRRVVEMDFLYVEEARRILDSLDG